MKCKAFTTGTVMLLLAGCTNIGKLSESDPNYKNILRMERDGAARNMATGKRTKVDIFKKRQLRKISYGIKNTDAKSIVVYVHGAPVLGDVTMKENLNKLRMIRSSENKAHPILFNWDGSFGDVYNDHLFRIRSGKEISKTRGFATYPFYLISDFIAGFAIAPGVWTGQIERIAEAEFLGLDFDGERTEPVLRQQIALQLKTDNETGDAENGKSCGCFLNVSETLRYEQDVSVGTVVSMVRSLPILVSSSILASGGRSAWKNYRRRAQMAVRGAKEFDSSGESPQLGSVSPTGMFAVLMDEILRIADGKKVILIGHSTGTMILTEYLSTILQRSNDKTKIEGAHQIRDIVFLGAASSVGDTHKTIFPFLQKYRDANFLNVSLNSYNEDKTQWKGVFLTGSILEWLDSSIAQPAGYLDRVIGRWTNVVSTMHTIPCEIGDRVFLIHLPNMEGYPTKHGELDDVNGKYSPFALDKLKKMTVTLALPPTRVPAE